MTEADKPAKKDEPRADGFAGVDATGDSPLGMFPLYFALTVLALGLIGYVVALLVPR